MSLEDTTIGFLGAGNMAEALVRGVLTAGKLPPQRITACDIKAERRSYFAEELSVKVTAEARVVVRDADVVVIAVKPQDIDALLEDVKASVRGDQLFISIAAGITCQRLENGLRQTAHVIRAMPNTPMLVGAGAVALCSGKRATAADMALAGALFSCAATVMEVEEALMDAVTATSGSGPAYFFYVCECLIDAAVAVGLSRDQAAALVRQTAYGAAKMVVETAAAPEELRRRVTSPGGTTEAAISVMEREDMHRVFLDAVKVAVERSVELRSR